jgi:HK97 family phage portal protein
MNETASMQVTAFWSCIRVITETFGTLAPTGAVYEKDRDGNLRRVDHDVSAILFETPNAEMTTVELHEALIGNIAQQGNGFALVDKRNDGSIFNMIPFAVGRTAVGRDPRTGKRQYDFNDRGKWTTYPAEKVWHIKGFGLDGLVGLSPLVYGRQALGLASAAEEFQAKFFANGASPSLIVSVPQWLNEKQRQQARENLEKMWSGLGNAHSARLLEGGMTPHPHSQKMQEAQFHELRGFSVEEIARVMRVPPHKIMKLDRSTNNNIEHQDLEFRSDTMLPYTTRMETSAHKWLFKPEERSRFVVRYDLDALLRADSAARGELHSAYVQNGIYNRNEVRVREGKNRVLGNPMMDAYTVQTNLAPIEMLPDLAEKLASNPRAQGSSLGGSSGKDKTALRVVGGTGGTV